MKLFRKILFAAIIAVVIFAPYIALSTETTAEAGSWAFICPTEVYATPIDFQNGSFEDPYRPSEFGAWLKPAEVPGWGLVVLPAYTEHSGELNYGEFQYMNVSSTGKGGYANTYPEDGTSQYVELNALYPSRIYQNIATVPGTRLLWQFAHRAIGGILPYDSDNDYDDAGYDTANLYIRAAGTPETSPTSSDLIQTATDDEQDWIYYRGTYTVPTGQTSTEISIESVSWWYDTGHGNFVDDVSVQTGASLIAKKSISTSASDNSYAYKGETVTITIEVTNWGETDASCCVLRDVLSDGLEYIDGSVEVNGADPAYSIFIESADQLVVFFGTGATSTDGGVLEGSIEMGTSGTTGKGETATITFEAVVVGDGGDVVQNQARIWYDDKDFESFSSGTYICYSSVEGETPTSSDETTYVNQFTIHDITIDGTTWYDTDGDGDIDTGETSISGLTVGVYYDSDTTYTTPVNDRFGDPLVTTTDSNGDYEFTAVPSGTYKIIVTTPSGYVVTALGSNKATADGDYAVINDVPLDVLNFITGANFGFYPEHGMNGRIWEDSDEDGMLDTSETRMSGMTVGVYLSTDTTYTTPVDDIYGDALVTTTNSNGIFRFSAIPAGTYKVVVTTPTGYLVTIHTSSTDNDAEASGTYATVSGVNLTYSGTRANRDFGFVVNRVITGRAWDDEDVDGMIDTSETRLSGLTVGVYLNSDTTYTTPVNDLNGDPLVTTTNSNGIYGFSGVPSGTYKLVTTTPSGYIVTVKTTSTDNNAEPSGTNAVISDVSLTSSASALYQDFGFTTNKTISGKVWYDETVDGILAVHESGVSSITVGLYENSDTSFTTPVDDIYGDALVTTTDSNGNYEFENVPEGTYKVVITTPSAYIVTIKTATTDNRAEEFGIYSVISDISLGASGSVTNQHIGIYGIRKISGYAWYDDDGDGMIDTSESWATGLTVGIYEKDDDNCTTPVNDIYGNPLVTTVGSSADAKTSGEYSFTAIPAGAYKVVMTTPSGYMVTLKTTSTDNLADPDGIYAIILVDMVGSGFGTSEGIVVLTDQDFGYVTVVGDYDLTLEKTVKGTLGDANEEFTFTINITGLTGSLNYTGGSSVTGVDPPADGTISDGGTVVLTHGQYITIADVPGGLSYEITETGGTGYTTTVTDDNASGIISEDLHVEFVNTKNWVIPTGVLMDILPHILIIAFVAAGFGLLVIFGKKKGKSSKKNKVFSKVTVCVSDSEEKGTKNG